MKPIKVKLTTDLSEYSPKLIIGTEGEADLGRKISSRTNDRFVSVHFPEIGLYDILWDSLEIIDDNHLVESSNTNLEKLDLLRSARRVVLVKGPRGKFKYLSYEYTDNKGCINNVYLGFKKEAEELLDLFKKYGVPYSEKKLTR